MKKIIKIIKFSIIGTVLIIVLMFVAALLSGEPKKETTSEQQSPQEQTHPEQTQQEKSTKKEVSYKVIEEKDISYAGCDRIAIKVVVPDEADKDDVNYTLTKIIDNYKSDWDDITVWAYKYSEEQQVDDLFGSTMGMKEYSMCE